MASVRSRRREVLAAYALMAPAFALVLGVLVYPTVWEAWMSLTDFSTAGAGPPVFVGFANYARLLGDGWFWRALATTVLYLAVTTLAKLALGVGLALLLAHPSRLRGVAFLAVFLPWAYPGAVTVIAWYWMLNPPLITSYSLTIANLKQAVDGVAGSGAWAFLSVVCFNVWRGGSFTAVFLLAGLNAIPTELFEYARLESRSAWQRFAAVTLPLLRPYLALAVFLSFTTAFADLDNVWMLTGGRIVFPVVGTYAFWLAIFGGQLGAAAAWTLSLVPLLALGLVFLFRWFDPPEETPA
jgi:multiple sugar transport system permease protein